MLTIHSQLHGVSFKKRAPKAIKEIKAFAKKSMVILPISFAHTVSKDCQYALSMRQHTNAQSRVPLMSASTHS